MLKYDVEVGYNHFLFDDADEAIRFAEIAKTKYVPRRGDELDVDIKIIVEDEVCENSEEEENKED